MILALFLIAVAGPLEADPEYQLIIEANNLTVEIDNEISKYWRSGVTIQLETSWSVVMSNWHQLITVFHVVSVTGTYFKLNIHIS